MTEDEMNEMRWLNAIINKFEYWKIVKDRETWCAAVHGVSESDMTCRLNNNNKTLEEAFNFLKSLIFLMKNKALLQVTGMVIIPALIQLCSCVNYSRPRVSTRSQWAKSGPPVFVDSFLEIQACIHG